MPNAKDILQVLIADLAAELAPLNSIYHDFVKYRVEAGFDNGFYLEVYAPASVRIFVPSTYQSFPVRFFEWEENTLAIDDEIDVLDHLHYIYSV
jgi:hypothetical protein